MAKINVLSSKIFNRIAAGEVVERPASVVKELVENSLDANAKNIVVSVFQGGISSINVTDDGCGIEKSQLNRALLPHATSKIATIDDLYNVSTLGFRGEALPSIASVSKLTIVSKPKDQQFGGMIYSEGGLAGLAEDSPSQDGTSITVDNLFFNTPAREKFLKSERSEENEIVITIARFILGNPNVSFKLICDGKQVLSSFGDGFESAFINVYGVSAIKECHYIETEKNGIKIKGYLAKPEYSKGNRSYQTVFLNSRYIQNQTISSAISNAYSGYIMKRRYPFYVLNVEIPTDVVDCNVHPNKLDVRFQNNQVVYGAIYSVVSKVLDGSQEALNIIKNNSETPSENALDYVTHNERELPKETFKFDKFIFSDVEEKKDNNKKDDNSTVDVFLENKKYLESLQTKTEQTQQVVQPVITIEKELKLVGQALNTYLFLEDGEDLYIIDQHAAHERILFDKFNEQIENAEVITQPLIVPFDINLNAFEFNFIQENIDVFTSLGIEAVVNGINNISIYSVPFIIAGLNIKNFFNDIVSDLVSLKSITLKSLLREKIAVKACRSAIKSGDNLTEDEINLLISMLKKNLGLKCPHGRPVAVKITRTEIDKWFKRIV
ncbi:MAG: DNA mismatch repair endonuclease MutL [Clostridia bacterium]|nr:DNA mismatch repair endonuclease MutL [Clostridia bacterium]